MFKKILYFFRNHKILEKFFVIFNYIILGFFSIIFKSFSFFSKKEIYFFQDRPFGIDNAYFLYKYYRKNFPEITSIYLVKNKKDASYKTLIEDKNIVYNFSIRHFWYFVNSKNIIYSFDTAPFYFFGKIGIFLKKIFKLNTNFIFLGHGTTRVYIPFFRKDNNIFNLFLVSSKYEKAFVDNLFGYNKETIVSGLPRFDNLLLNSKRKKQIFFFPTWNNKLNGLSNKDFMKTDYFKKIKLLLESSELYDWLNKNDYKLFYYPHQGIKQYINLFNSDYNNDNIIILDDNNDKNISISQLISESSILITNYSSIIFDFAYQLKNIIYYDIGIDHYNKKATYYYDFGKKVKGIKEIVQELDIIGNNNFKMGKEYIKNTNDFFDNIDTNNCYRNSLIINNLKQNVQ